MRRRINWFKPFIFIFLFSAALVFANEPKVPTLSDWSGQVAEAWEGILRNSGIKDNSVIVEIAPGSSPKVGVGIQQVHPKFKGTIYIVEPDDVGLAAVTKSYSELFPNAKIVGVKALMSEAAKKIPRVPPIDAVLSNHPIDDMIIGKSLSGGDKEFQALFNGMYGTNERESLQKAIEYWSRLETKPDFLAKCQSEVVSEWVEFIKALNPRYLGISQYPSRTLERAGVVMADNRAREVLQGIRQRLGQVSSLDERTLRIRGFDPHRWTSVRLNQPELAPGLPVEPDIIRRIGKKNVTEETAYRLNPTDVEVLGWDRELAEHHFNIRGLSNDEIVRRIKETFAIDLEPEKRSGPVVMTFADRQSDGAESTKGISLSGNLGSGRAVYIDVNGESFNVKGPGRTKLVGPNPSPGHGNGRVALQVALWEMHSQNAIARNLSTGGNQVLAVIDLKRIGDFGKFGSEPTALVIRKGDETLDRPAHVFQSEGLDVDLLTIADRFGRQDGEKFIRRYIHGAWSNGNISLGGGQIDSETVSSVDGRAPMYTNTGKYLPNFFGLEGEGQIKILEDLHRARGSQGSNSLEELKRRFASSRKDALFKGFLSLMGLEASEIAAVSDKRNEHTKTRAMALLDEFLKLAPLMYPDAMKLAPRGVGENDHYVLHFSRLFRNFPEVFGSKAAVELGVELLMNPTSFRVTVNPKVKPGVEEAFNGQQVRNSDEYQSVRDRAQKFVALYSELLGRLEKEKIVKSMFHLSNRAYVMNEDNPYMNNRSMGKFFEVIAHEYQNGKISAKRVNEYMGLLQTATNRVYMPDEQGHVLTDVEVLREGIRGKRLNSSGRVQWFYSVFPDMVPNFMLAELRKTRPSFSVLFNGNLKVPLRYEMRGDRLEFTSDFMPAHMLSFKPERGVSTPEQFWSFNEIIEAQRHSVPFETGTEDRRRAVIAATQRCPLVLGSVGAAIRK